MIGVYYGGRFGNQFLIYALARFLRYERGDVDSFVFNFDAVDSKDYNDGFEDILKYFNVVDYTVKKGNLLLKYGALKQIYGTMKHKLIKSDGKELVNYGIYYNYNSIPVKKNIK